MDIEELLKSLNAHNVEFVIIGATAFPIHGYARATLDIDIFIKITPENPILWTGMKGVSANGRKNLIRCWNDTESSSAQGSDKKNSQREREWRWREMGEKSEARDALDHCGDGCCDLFTSFSSHGLTDQVDYSKKD